MASAAANLGPLAALTVRGAIDVTAATPLPTARFVRQDDRLHADTETQRVEVSSSGVRLKSKLSNRTQRRAFDQKVRALSRARTRATVQDARRSLAESFQESRDDDTSLHLETTSVARAGYECIEGSGRLRIANAGEAERAFSGCSEIWTNTENKSEQSYRFERRPSGSGDLVFQVAARFGAGAASAVDSVETDDRGLHLQSTRGQRFAYAHGVWVDAAGTRMPIPAHWAGDHIEMRVPAEVVQGSRYPAVLDPEVGPEIGTDPAVIVPTDLGHNPELASDGRGFLSVQEVDTRIRAVRVDGSGSVLDANWIDLGESNDQQLYPSVAFGAGRYLVAWSATQADGSMIVKGRFVNPDGSVVGAASLRLSGGEALYPSLAWNGQNFVATWLALGGQGLNDIQVVLLDQNGNRVQGSEHTASTSSRASNPRIAIGGTQAFVAWEEYTHSETAGDTVRIRGARIASDGSVLDPGGVELSNAATSEMGPDVASTGSSFLVTWATSSSSPNEIRGSVVGSDGVVSAKDFVISHSAENTGAPAVVFDGANFVVAWADERDNRSMYGTRVAPNGTVSGNSDVKLASGSPRYVGSASDHTNLAWNGSHYLLTFLGNGIEGSLVTDELSVAKGTIPLTGVANPQGYPRTAFNGKDYVIAWTDERVSSSEMSVRSVRVSGSGHVLDPAGIVVSTADNPAWTVVLGSNRKDSTQIFWAGTDSRWWQRTLSNDGSLGENRSFAFDSSSLSDIGSNGSGYLAVSTTGDSRDGTVFGKILDASGNGGTEFRIDSSTINTGPSVIPAENDYLVAYSRAGTRIVPVSATGTVGQSLELSTGIAQVRGATSGTNTFVLWGGYEPNQVYGRLFKAGAPVGNVLTLADSSAGYGATVAWDGASYWAVWENEKHVLFARSVGPDGTLGTASILVDDECFAPVLASDGAGQMLLSYSKYGQSMRTRRIVSRLVGKGAGDAGTSDAAVGPLPEGGTGGSTVGTEGGAGGSNLADASGSGGSAAGGSPESDAGAAGRAGNMGTGGGSGTSDSGVDGSSGTGGDEPSPACNVQRSGNSRASASAGMLIGLAVALRALRQRRLRS